MLFRRILPSIAPAVVALSLALFSATPAFAQGQPPAGVIVRTSLGGLGLNTVCLLEGCTVVRNLDGNLDKVYLVQPGNGVPASTLASALRLVTGIIDAEVDQGLAIPVNPPPLSSIPEALYDNTPVTYYGAPATDGYINQPAAQIINLASAQAAFGFTGSSIVADIDTGVDPNHPALKPVLLPGYDFTRNQAGGSELNDISFSGTACSTCNAANVNQQTAAMVDQQTAAMVDGTPYSAFGHGTMVLGLVHLVAPTAQLLPLKAFHSDGSGNLSDIIRAVYYAVQNGAKVINMSFDLSPNSTEFASALNYATQNNLICVASAGNDGVEEIVYPAAYQSNVMGVASTSNTDARSTFSNYGDAIVWLAAPGENIVSTYPFGTYATSSGTSFSAPLVSGTAALLVQMIATTNQSQAATAFTHEVNVGPDMGYGRLDIYETLSDY
jgi:subtilisin family serine protease